MAIEDQVREILLRDWDPHEVMKWVEIWGESARLRYDVYIGPLVELVSSGAREEEVMGFLAEREGESMCFPGLGRERLRLVSRRLVGLIRDANGQ